MTDTDNLAQCTCFWCKRGKAHPTGEYHDKWLTVTSRLLVAESLDPAHSIPIEACRTCAHKRVKSDIR